MSGRAFAATRAVVPAAAAGTALVLGWLMLATTFGRPQPPAWPGWLVFVVNLGALGALLAARRATALAMTTALLLGAAVALPFWAALVHTWLGGPSAATPVTAAVAGSAAAITVLAGLTYGPDRLLLAGVVAATAITWLSLLAGGAELLGAAIDASYHKNDRSWLGIWQLRGIAGHPNVLCLVAVLALLGQLDVIRRRRWTRATSALVVAGPLASLLVVAWSQSRSGWICLVAGAAVLALPWQRDRRGFLAAAVVIGSVALTIGPVLSAAGPLAFNGRGLAWLVARAGIESDPLLGPGPWWFGPDFWAQYGSQFAATWYPLHAHNALLQAGTLLGLVGIALTVGAWAASTTAAVRARREDHGLSLAMLAALAAFAGVEAAFGVGFGGAVYVPVILVAAALGAALTPAAARPVADRSAPDSSSRGLPFVAGGPDR